MAHLDSDFKNTRSTTTDCLSNYVDEYKKKACPNGWRSEKLPWSISSPEKKLLPETIDWYCVYT